MRVHLTERGPEGDEGEHYQYETDLDLSGPDEAYVKGREWHRLTASLTRGISDEHADQKAREEASDDG